MKIVVAMDSFKGGLSAADACRAVAAGLRDAAPGVEVMLAPMADGGEGTAAALLAARPGGRWVKLSVAGPLPERKVRAGYAFFPDENDAVVEMALANGLPLLREHERDPLKTSSYGTGQLIRAAMEQPVRRILLAIGGSATVDGGVGAAAALGWRFLDAHGREIPRGGGYLRLIDRVIPPAESCFPGGCNACRLTVLCDVKNPLLGRRGAAAVFGPQKGATPQSVALLEEGLANLAGCVRRQLGFDMTILPGAGAAGGLGAGAAAFFNAELVSGIDTVMETVKLERALRGADWCVTGEGSFDNQSLHGKVISGVAATAQKAGVPVVVFAGRVKAASADYRPCGIHKALAMHGSDMPLEEVLRREPELLRAVAARWLSRTAG